MSKAISYSRYGTFEKCPAQYNHKYNLKTPLEEEDVAGPAAHRGTQIHANIEDYLLHKINEEDLRPELKNYVEWLGDLRSMNCQPEAEYCFDSDWNQVEWDDPEGNTRGIIDGLLLKDDDTAVVYDWKTGQIYDSHVGQRVLYGLYIMMAEPHLRSVETMMVYIDKGKNDATVIDRAMVNSIKWTWERNFNKLRSGLYPERPGQHCRWCPYSKKKGGPCKVG